MKAGNFNIREYLNRLYENAEASVENKEGIIIPDENRKAYDWLKKEYNSSQTAVKVEISGQGASFKPGYDLQATTDSAAEFKPGTFGSAKADDSPGKGEIKKDEKESLDPKKEKSEFQAGEGEKKKEDLPKTSDKKDNIKDKEEDDKDEEKEEKEEKPETEKPEVKKIDLKTKK